MVQDQQQFQPTTEPSSQLWLAVELLTDRHRVRGQVKRSYGTTRLGDVLNSCKDPFLSLAHAEIESLAVAKAEVVTRRVAFVSLAAISLAIPLDDVAERLRTHMGTFEYAERVRHEASVVLPLFEVRGMIHLPRGVEATSAPFLYRPAFVPITDAEAVYIPCRDLVWRSQVIIVNMAKAQLYYLGLPSPVAPRRRASAEAPLHQR